MAVRGLAVAALLSAFGALLFRAAVLPKVARTVPVAARHGTAVLALARGSLGVAAVFLVGWGAAQTAAFAGPGLGAHGFLQALPVALTGTLFGHLLLGQLAATVAAGLLLPRWPGAALGAATAALLLQAGHGHAWSGEDGPGLLAAAGAVHLLAAGAWLGGLLPLWLVVQWSPPRTGALAARWFSPLGKACVAGLVLSAAVQGWVLVGGVAGWVGTPYGWAALAKLGLFAVLFTAAVLNRYRWAPALLGAEPEAARRCLLWAMAVQTGAGLLAVAAAGTMTELPPAAHEQPWWPFPLRPSLAVMAEPELAGEVWLGALLAAGAAVAVLLPAWRPLRRPWAVAGAGLAACVLLLLAWPHLSLLLVEAYPTSYYVSPTGFAAPSILAGAALFPQNCARCHGAEGRGDGPDAAALPIPPADLTASHLWEHADGEMFWWLAHGMPAPDDTPAMPGFADTLTAAQRWALIDAVRARNAGFALRDGDAWPAPVPLPGFTVDCPERGTVAADELRGAVLLVAAGPGTVIVTPEGGAACRATGPEARDALAVVTGHPDGVRLLVDGNGWLRTVEPAPGAWDDGAALRAAERAVAADPLAALAGGHHHH